MKLDAHQHFWKFDPVRDAWISDAMSVLRRDFLPTDLEPVFQENGIDGCVAVQADQSDTETEFLLDLARKYPFIKAVVGWIDIRSKALPERLDRLAGHTRLKGFRHILQGEKPEFMLQPDFIRGIHTLGKRGFTYDILVFPRHLNAVASFLKINDNQPFIIDHLAKPYIKQGKIKQWSKDLRAIARHEQVYCKLSGMVTEADWTAWKPSDMTPYLEVALEAFGPRRLVYGSDWPVCLLAGSYKKQMDLVTLFIQQLSPSEQAQIMGQNALHFYRIES
ncbi:MAG: amidohydrolase family protein [Saprospiraceae bacterium]|nr:amidohydrolase family protein [Saprospiraceae bacterium]